MFGYFNLSYYLCSRKSINKQIKTLRIMKSLDTILERNRKKARNLMMDNNISNISIVDKAEFGRDTALPYVVLRKKDGESYETLIEEIKLSNGEIYIKVFNDKNLSSDMFVNEDGDISDVKCLSYSANEIYRTIEYYIVHCLHFDDKIHELNKEFEQKFINLLTEVDEKTFTFKKCDMFHTCAIGKETSIKDIFMNGSIVVLKTNEGRDLYLCELGLENICKLLKHFIDCLKDKC